MTALQPATGFLVTFAGCGHVQHFRGEPRPGGWVSGWGPRKTGCQTSCQVQSVKPCTGCPDCWRQPDLFGGAL